MYQKYVYINPRWKSSELIVLLRQSKMTYAEKLKQGVATVEAYIEDTGTLEFLSAIADELGIEII